MRVIVTRPAREAARWVADLGARGLDAVALPLIEIASAPDPAALVAARARLGAFRAAMFVSANAVEHFLAPALPGPLPAEAWATGPGTRAALLRAGLAAANVVSPPADAAQFDSEALWALVGATVRPGEQVLLVRGADAQGRSAGRDWFSQQLSAAGVAVEFVVAYQRRAPALGPEPRMLAQQAAHDGSVWLFSSSEAVVNLCAALPGQNWAAARAVATHARIADAARDAGFGVVCVSRPAVDDVVASIESFA